MRYSSRRPTVGGRGTARLRTFAAVVVLALVVAACGGGHDEESDTTGGGSDNGDEPIVDASACPGSQTTGVAGNTIKIGTSLPQSGLYSAFSNILVGESAYFEYLNEELGGVEIDGEKYTIELVNKDDEYQAEKTVANVNQLINDDEVFALFNVVGTKNNLAIHDIANDQCVPNLFAATGSPAWGNKNYPWTLGSELVPYPLEMKALFDYLQENDPEATVAILRANDDFGAAYSETFKSLVEGSDITVVKEETYNVEQFDTKSQVTSLAASDADVFIVAATLLACPDALNNAAAAGWEPTIYMSGTCTSKTLMDIAGAAGEGVISVAPLLDPANPDNASNEEMTLYKEQVAAYDSEVDTDNAIVAYGWTTAALFTDLLSKSPALDRASVMEAARAYDVSGVSLMIPDQSFVTDAEDWFLGETFYLSQFGDGYFAPISDLIDENGKTADYTPTELINN